MAPSTPRLSLPTVTPGASAYMPDPEPEREPEPEPEPGWWTPPSPAYISHVYKVGRSPGPRGGSLGEDFLWFLLQAEVAASSGGSTG